MSLLDKASLIVTPNGFKASKLYSVVPSSGAGDLDVTRATTATRVNSLGLIESVANNVPRIDYTNGSCPSLLVEPQRTNLFLYSEQFDNAVYAKFNVSVTSNSIISPDGNTTADFCNYTDAANFLIAAATNTINSTYTISVFAKKGSGNILRIREAFYFGSSSVFNLNTGTVVSGSGKIENYGNGWYRCSITQVYTNLQTNIQWSFDTDSTINNLYLWGAQCEAGTYLTSYIPTTTASVTRNADVISKTAISSLIGQTEGTLFLDTNINNISSQTNEPVLVYISGFAQAYIEITPTGRVYGVFYNGTTSTGFINANIGLQNGRHKFAFGYKDNDFTLFLDGVQIGTDTSGLVSGSLTEFGLQYNQNFYVGTQAINASGLWKTRLTNAELAELTTI